MPATVLAVTLRPTAAPRVARRQAKLSRSSSVRVHGKKSGEIHEELKEKFTTGGGGYKGFCDYEEIREAIKECDGLDGDRLEACYAQFGCDIDQVTDHYAKAAGIEKKKDAKK